MYGNRDNNRFVPVKVGDELDVKIEAVGEKGDGIAKKDGFVIFVPGVKEGDEVKIKVTRVLRRVGFGEVAGKASAPVEASEAPADSSEPSEEAEPVAEESPEDSEDFGEEPSEESEPSDEAEEPSEESEPSEEAEEPAEEEEAGNAEEESEEKKD